MKVTRLSVICGILMLLLAGSVWGADGTITGITVKPTNPGVNQAIEVTVQGTITPGKKCSIIFLKGDGTPQSQVGHATSFPFKFGGQAYPLFVYDKTGTYPVKVYSLDDKCTGKAQADVKVVAKLKKVLPGGAVPIGQNPCPQGWHKKSGSADSAYTCVPNKPTQKPQCTPGTEYFETECTVGCQVVIK
jgi:hypothetical protein